MIVQLRNGDTIEYLRKMFHLPLNLLIDSNSKLNSKDRWTPHKIKIPGYCSVPFTIREGDTLETIAAAKRLAVDSLKLINPRKDLMGLHPGETILIPKRVSDSIVNTETPSNSKWLAESIFNLKKLYPFIAVHSAGRSVLGKPLWEIRIGNGPKKIHMNGSFHANEWITTTILMKLLERYLYSLVNNLSVEGYRVNDLYRRSSLSIVPMVNPDGVDLVLNGPPEEEFASVMAMNENDKEFVHWKANIRGVDLNKQYPANWEIDQRRKAPKDPGPRDYPGIAPLTEPESIALAELAKRRKFDHVLAFHTQGEEFYWGYEGMEPVKSEMMAKEFERRSGYKAIQYVDSHGGYKDWFIQEFKRPGFTIELGKGINPLPLSHLDKIIKSVNGIFFGALGF